MIDLALSYSTYRLIMLLAMTTAQRAQTLHAISIDNIIMSENMEIIAIKTMLKQTNIFPHPFGVPGRPHQGSTSFSDLRSFQEGYNSQKGRSFFSRKQK